MTAPLVLYETSDRVATLKVNRPDKLNALNAELLVALGEAVDRARTDRAIRAVVITGIGRAFVAGADIGEIAMADPSALEAFARRGQSVFRAIEQSGKPVVAAINGFALGGGCELALACHLRVASTAARIGLPEVRLGLIPGYGGTQRLPRLVGRGASLRLILSGEPIDGAEAHRIGLVEFLSEPDLVLSAAQTIAAEIAKNAPVALERALRSVDEGLDLSIDDALANEARLFGSLGLTADMREGTRAFLEKRKAEFRGE